MALARQGKALIEPEDRQPAGAFDPNQSLRDIAFLGQVVINCGILARRRKRMGGKARKKQTRIRRLGPAETSAVLCSAGD
jgi:hypothetical protein